MNRAFDPTAELEQLLRLPTENEIVEFKKTESAKHFDDTGKYFSALSNEANPKSVTNTWLVFGINHQPRFSRSLVGV